MEINLIVAAAKNLVIGKEGRLPWKLEKESQYFKSMVRGHICVYGRKTYESSSDKEERINYVVTKSNQDFVWEHLEELAILHPDKKIFILGGEKIYEYFLPYCHRIYFTLIDLEVEGDTRFPPFKGELVHASEIVEDGGVKFQCQIYENVDFSEDAQYHNPF